MVVYNFRNEINKTKYKNNYDRRQQEMEVGTTATTERRKNPWYFQRDSCKNIIRNL